MLLTVAVVVLEAAFLRSDFSVALVADHSSTTTPLGYKMTALWGSQGGSLLLWAWVLSIASSAVLWMTRHRHREVVPYATAVLAGLGLFFTVLMLAGANPFERLSPVPAEGVGLNPLLRHPAMAIHPPMLYSGYVLWSIPFAFAIGALVTRRLDASWIRQTRRFALVAWIFLSIGILLGARWSYSELGWGGYWGWDPVENASLMPWLAGTAFLHSVMVQEKRGMLKVWNVSLIVATFSLALLGTFLVRSGILESIHAFGASTVGTPLLGLIAIVIAGSAALIVSRLPDLKSERRIESLASRESIFLINNLLLLGPRGRDLLGHVLPADLRGVHRRASRRSARRGSTSTRRPLAIVLGAVHRHRAAAGLAQGERRGDLAAGACARRRSGRGDGRSWRSSPTRSTHPLALVLFAFAFFALAALVSEFWRGAAAQRSLSGGSWPTALVRVVARNRRRYGGYIVHAGIAILFLAVAASSSFQDSSDMRLEPGESGTVGDYTVTYVNPTSRVDRDEQALEFGSVISVERDGEQVALLTPSRNYYSSTAAEQHDPRLLRGRGDKRGRAQDALCRRHLVGHATRPHPLRRVHRRGRPPHRRRQPGTLRSWLRSSRAWRSTTSPTSSSRTARPSTSA